MQESTKILIKASIINCGIATMLINAIICYFTLPDAATLLSSDLAFNFASTVFGCGLICPFFGALTFKGVMAKNPDMALGAKSSQLLARFVPNNAFLAAIVIAIMTSIILCAIPFAILALLNIEFTAARIFWLLAIGVYSGIAATFAMYFGMKRVYYTRM